MVTPRCAISYKKENWCLMIYRAHYARPKAEDARLASITSARLVALTLSPAALICLCSMYPSYTASVCLTFSRSCALRPQDIERAAIPAICGENLPLQLPPIPGFSFSRIIMPVSKAESVAFSAITTFFAVCMIIWTWISRRWSLCASYGLISALSATLVAVHLLQFKLNNRVYQQITSALGGSTASILSFSEVSFSQPYLKDIR